eukprot:TRINITY_DN35388_c0_g1_i2.p1 TRINITY_DN35388_c0_g1~~TRINITY_DN35388_c0_g1_i2.p1  ORF type:complete len:340 (-),score=72.54 TRINITY_DN35388_c0_g1_i2:49-1068(-)
MIADDPSQTSTEDCQASAGSVQLQGSALQLRRSRRTCILAPVALAGGIAAATLSGLVLLQASSSCTLAALLLRQAPRAGGHGEKLPAVEAAGKAVDADAVQTQAASAAEPVDYVIGNVWLQSTPKRAVEMDAAMLGGNLAGDDSRVRRLLVPTRFQDVHLLRLLKVEHLRVDLWPHRAPEPHVHVRILTNAVSFEPKRSPQKWSRLSRFFASDGGQWLTLMQAVVHMPRGVALMSCNHEWRWADFNETEASWREAISPPFRVLEIACPRRPRGIFLPGSIVMPPSGPGGRMAPRDLLVSGFRVAFVAMLIIVCVAQVMLLMVCITMLILQMGVQRRQAA